MKIALICFHSFSQPGGVKRHVLDLGKELKRQGIELKIIVPRRKKEEDYGEDVILLGTSFPINFVGSRSDFDVNFNPLAIEKVLERENFDVLHFHNFGFPSAFQILEKSKALNILTFHSNIEGSKILKALPFLMYFLNRVVRWKMDGVIGVAPLNLRNFRNCGKPRAVIPNGINLEEFSPEGTKIKRFLDGKINILFVGRIEERKGLIYLLRAFKILTKKFSNLRLIVVGEGELKGECESFVKENGLKEVCFEGEITGKKLPSYYRTSDIFCSPAIFGESFGLVLIEAMASGKPVVAFANEGYRGVLKGKGKKFLVKPRNYKSLAKKLEILIRKPKLRKEMSAWGRKEAQNYSWNKIAGRVLNFYQLCLKRKERKGKRKDFIEKSFDKILGKTYNHNILNWLKKPR